MSLLINIAGLVLIVAIVWWFWLAGRRSKGEHYSDSLEILVRDGVYEPDRIEVPAGQAITLHFRREDPSPCAEYVVFADLDISQQLTVDAVTDLRLPALEKGEYPFTCQMQMYRGVLVVG
ncbi:MULTISPECIES: cupredoxin domain-containing protein [Microbulbifer]|uniref:Cupredoxin domain-containing protein n=1 Tax=Microbulbifer celer TaxID=435905 RepID=A0ABW3UDJ7_9GAMM|nr:MULTISPECIES: cupredoxin domain-containing protein [Microbulbifer]UFN59255.1 cupredoxin domain-containing protein [Microbulbifer celer]